MENEKDLKATLSVLESVNSTVEQMGGDAQGVSRALKIAMIAVKQQIPERPFKDVKCIPDHVFFVDKCPCCGVEVLLWHNYCGNCGKRLNWIKNKIETIKKNSFFAKSMNLESDADAD